MAAQTRLLDVLCFQTLMEHSADSIYFKDRKCRLQRANRKMISDLGLTSADDVLGKTDVDLFGEVAGARTMLEETHIMESGEPVFGLIESRRSPDGQTNWTLTSKVPVHDQKGHVIGLMGITREVGELKQNDKNLRHLATHDFLTDLPNRFLMHDRLEQVLARAQRSRSPFAILRIDLAGFKAINNSHGPEAGDLILRQVGARLKKCVRTTDSVARPGADKFVIILATLQRVEDVPVVAQKVLECFAQPFTLKGEKIQIGASIGISLHPDHGKDVESLLSAANYATTLSKRRPGSFVICPTDPTEFTASDADAESDA